MSKKEIVVVRSGSETLRNGKHNGPRVEGNRIKMKGKSHASVQSYYRAKTVPLKDGHTPRKDSER